ncbi:hypothetical protein D9M73_234510 [compost metagenome]
MAQTGEEVAALALQVFVLGVGVAQFGVGLGVVVGLAVGGGVAPALVDVTVEPGGGIARVVGADVDVPLHHAMLRLQRPDRVLPRGAGAGRRAVRQADIELVVALVVVELDDVDV